MWVLKTEGPPGNMSQYTLFAGERIVRALSVSDLQGRLFPRVFR